MLEKMATEEDRAEKEELHEVPEPEAEVAGARLLGWRYRVEAS